MYKFNTFAMKPFFLSIFSLVFFTISHNASGMNKYPVDTLPDVRSEIEVNTFVYKIIGVVEASTGGVLPNASVALVGYSTAVSADVQGKFTLIVPGANNYTLRTNYVGCITKDTPVEVSSTEKHITIKLECDFLSSEQQVSGSDYIYDNSQPAFNPNAQKSVFDKIF